MSGRKKEEEALEEAGENDIEAIARGVSYAEQMASGDKFI